VREFDGVKYDPITVSSIILKRMKEYAEDQGGDEVKDVVITCPAYFGNEERAATKQAGIIAGLNVLNIVNEPTAAALNYCCREFQENRKIMVYDLGGGTFDITLFDFSVNDAGKATIDVIDTGGDDRLGGIDWDSRFYDYVCELYCDETGLTSDQIDNELRVIIKGHVEATKKLLSRKSAHSFNISYMGDTSRIEVSAEKFEELTQDLVERTMDFVQQLLSNNSLTPDDVDVVLLVGGSTRMPMIKKAVEGLFPSKVRVEDPDLAVAKGAALAAAIEYNEHINRRVTGQADEYVSNQDSESNMAEALPPITEEEAQKLMIDGIGGIGLDKSVVNDKISRSFGPGVRTDLGFMIDNLLFVGDELPSELEKRYFSPADNVSMLVIPIFENVAKDRQNTFVTPSVDENDKPQYTDPALKVKLLGELRLGLPPGTPKGAPIDVFFRCSATGLEIRATNVTTGESVEAIITSENTKTQEELAEAVEHMASVRTSGNI
jgi:molecular chaperone DnaK (HSP70)